MYFAINTLTPEKLHILKPLMYKPYYYRKYFIRLYSDYKSIDNIFKGEKICNYFIPKKKEWIAA